MKISLAMIVAPTKAESQRLNRALKSVAGVFDEICITQAGPHPDEEVSKVIEKHGGKESFFTWIGDFAAARNYNFKQCTGDWIFWMDADDLIMEAGNIRKNIQTAEDNKVTGLSVRYDYSHDEKGRVKDHHMKLQMVKNGYYEWKGVIHEDLLPIKEGHNASIKDVRRIHTAKDEDSLRSLKRNIEILEKAMVDEPDEPRHYFYAARCYLGLEKWDQTIDVIEQYLQLSNWPAERYDALNMEGEAYMRLGEYGAAIKSHSRAILELEDAPDAYIYKARNYMAEERWVQALVNLEIAELRDKDAVILKREALYDHDLYVMSAVCYMNLGEYQAAMQAANRAYNNRPSDQSLDMYQMAKGLTENEELTKTYRKLGESLIEDKEKLRSLLSTVPDVIKDDPRLLALKFGAQEPKVWADNSVAYFCGNSVESWNGDSTKTGGIGGSETAVIEIAKDMASKGKEVVVFNKCDAPADGMMMDGVLYKNYWEFNKEDEFNTVILWRAPQFLDVDINAKTIILDMHDVSSNDYFTPERVAKVDHVFVKTNYHKTLYPNVPDEKFVVVGNGIDLTRFKGKKVKNKHRFIYTSCASRGLENILDVWPKIKERVPEAELHVFYGWKTFTESHKNNPAKLQWVKDMQEKMKQDGITNHGRVDQQTLAEEMMKSNLWLYPTEFPEIHCITALEMQASEVYPITTGYAALEETQQSGVKIEGDPKTEGWRERFVNEIVFAVKNHDMLEEEITKGNEYVKECSWSNVTDTWLDYV